MLTSCPVRAHQSGARRGCPPTPSGGFGRCGGLVGRDVIGGGHVAEKSCDVTVRGLVQGDGENHRYGKDGDFPGQRECFHPSQFSKSDVSPLPKRTTDGVLVVRSTTVVGVRPQAPPSMTRST